MSRPYAKLPAWIDFGLIPLLNLVIAFAIAGLVVLMVGESPIAAARLMLQGAFGYGEGFGFTLYYTTNFIFTGLAVAVAFHAGLFNIGGEGQAYVGGLGVGLVSLVLDRLVPWWVTLPFAILGGFLFGALWALIPAWLQARRGSHIVITTIMFNFIAASLMVYLLVGPLKPVGSMNPQSRTFEAGAQLPKLDGLFAAFGADLGGAPLNITLFLALIAAFLVWLLIFRTRLGYELRTLGFSPPAARYAGMSQTRLIVIAMTISGGLAGLMALNPVIGDQYRVQIDLAAGAGFVGIAVALMGRAHPAGIIPAALLFGVLYQGGAELAFEMPSISRDMIVIIQGLVILFAGALENMLRPAVGGAYRRLRLPATQTLPVEEAT
ncbi:ABC transporter permease [Aurantimonas sp. MSK8Z-1]|uniref:ABC transporter permease n=1 Tax=Mangrovibrevibacter kandeliae TaxID=2968473 RepID=UPI0021187D5F|nr:ABC transporter permease [Aurantimonas sp. MSK8Z-1]MCW4115953.1 ABC transporter permease [Aurantimonas sp. MSK8Z-1]